MSKKINYGKRTAPTAYQVNKGRDFHDDYGVLKEGYNTTGGEGMMAVGTTTVTGTVGAGKDGMRGYTEEKTVFGPKDVPAETTSAPPVAEPQAEIKSSNQGYQLSRTAADSKAYVDAYEQVKLPNQGTSTILGSDVPGQDFKNTYQQNLTEELKTKVPRALAEKVSVIEQADATALLKDNFNLNLAHSGMQPGQAGRRGLAFN